MTINHRLKRITDLFYPSVFNMKGASISDKCVVIESDDWGAIRMPSSEALEEMERRGFDLDDSIYKYDSLASQEDLENLFDLLGKYRDAQGNHPTFTANTIVANPDFRKIRESGFRHYFYETFTETFKRYPQHQHNFQIWQKAIVEGLFKPQFHGREHVNVNRWMKALQEGNSGVLTSFDLHSTYSGRDDYSFMESFDWDDKRETSDHRKIIEQGLDLFEELFGYRSNSFIAPCYCWDPDIENALFKGGIEWLQGLRSQYIPQGGFENYSVNHHSFGEMNRYGIRYNIRNCFFEPSLNRDKDWVGSCMAKISNAFFWKKPAVISSHRINYVGFIDPKNRDRNLILLDELLSGILKKWPDVTFITTDRLSANLKLASYG